MFSNSKAYIAAAPEPGSRLSETLSPPSAMPASAPSAAVPNALPAAVETAAMSMMPGKGSAETGSLPNHGLLAAAYVPFQRENSPRYSKEEALNNGTLFPGLNLPYADYLPAKDAAKTPQGELMALAFVLNDLGLYLDTHPKDTEALRLRNGFVELYNKALTTMEREHGPMTQNTVMENGYTWIDNPWPWEK